MVENIINTLTQKEKPTKKKQKKKTFKMQHGWCSLCASAQKQVLFFFYSFTFWISFIKVYYIPLIPYDNKIITIIMCVCCELFFMKRNIFSKNI